MPGWVWLAVLALIAAAGWLTSLFVARRSARNELRMRAGGERRAQAEKVAVWQEPPADPQPVALLNHSDEPVYDAVATFVFVDGTGPARGEEIAPERAGWRVRVGVIPPGRWRVRVDGGWNGMYSRLGVEVAFTDCAGEHWVRRADGRLEQLPRGAFDYFELSRPLNRTPPEHFDAAEHAVKHRARVSAFSLGDGLGRRWSARCSCRWLVTTASHAQACDEFARHHREARGSLAWRAVTPPDRAAA